MSDDEPRPDDDGTDPPVERRSRWLIPLVVVVVALAGLAAGAGFTPSDAVDAVRGIVESDPSIDEAAAEVVADDASDAMSVEVRFGPTENGAGECVFVRTIADASGVTDGEQWCVDAPMLPWSDAEFELRSTSQYFGFVHETPIGNPDDGFDGVALSGAVHPAITAIAASFGDGTEYSFVPDDGDGWFVVILPDEIADLDRDDGTLVNVLVGLRLFDNEGRALTTVDVPAWRLETGLR